MQQVRPETGCACPHTGREQYLSPANTILATLPHVDNKVRDCTAQGHRAQSTSPQVINIDINPDHPIMSPSLMGPNRKSS